MTNNYSASRKSGLMMFVFVLFAVLGLQKGAFAQTTIADWEMTGLTLYGPSPFTPTTQDPNVTVVGLTRGAGMTTLNTAASSTWGGNGFLSTTDAATAIAADDYAYFSVQANSGYQVSLNSILPHNVRRTSTGPATGQWQYSIDGVNYSNIGSEITYTATTTAGNAQAAIDLSGISDLQNVPSGVTITIRLVLFNATGSTGNFYLRDIGTTTDFGIDGTVALGGATPSVTASVATLPDFGSVNVGSTSSSQSFTVDATDLLTDVTVAVGGDYQVSLDNTNWFSSVDIPMGSGTLTGVTVYVQFAPLSSGVQSNTVTLTTSGASDSVGVIGTGAATSSELSDIIVDPTFVYPTNIDYASYQETDLTASSLEVARFLVRDGGASTPDADALGTLLNNLDFAVTNASVLRRVAIYSGSTELAEVDAAGTLTFTGAPILTIADDTEEAISIRVSFQATVNDNTQFDFTVTTAAADITGSRFAVSNGGGAATSTAGDDNRIEVTASLLTFTTQPSTTVVNTGMGDVIVRAFDALGNRDFDFAGDISITSSGALVGTPVVVTAASGSATFSALTHSIAANGLTLTAASTGLTSATSLTFDITNAPILTFEMAAAAGNEASFPSATNDAAINAATLTRAASLTASTNGGRFNATNWSTSAALDNSISYMEFTISPVDANSAFSVERIFVAIQRSGTGPGFIALRSSLDGYTADLGGAFSIVDNTSTQTFDFNFTQALASQTVTYRVYMYAAESTGGSCGIGDFTGNDIEVYGTTAVLECNDPGACNYNPADTNADGCTYPIAYYIDADFDGYASGTEITCTPGAGYTIDVLPLGDCDDNNFDVNPGVAEDLCNGIDDNCDTNIDEGAVVGCTDPLASNYNAGATCPGPCSYAGSYTAGNLVAIRGGDGSATLPTSGSGHDTYLEQMDTNGNTVSVLPLTNGPTQLAVNLGSTASGFISRTQDGTAIVVGGYDVANGGAISGADRVANLVEIDYTVTRLFADATVYSGSTNLRGAASNGTDVWTAGASTGIYHAGPGTPEVISNNSTNNRVIKQINGDLYFSTGSSAAGAVGIYRIAGSPTTGLTDATLVVGTGGNPYDFEFSPNGKSLYVADDNASSGGVKKYTFDGTSWNLAATYTVVNYGSVSGLAIDFTGSTPVIYAVSRNTTTNETIILSFFDDNVSGDVTYNTLKLDDYLTVRYRDIEFAPCNGTTWYEDADGDGYGNPNVSIVDCMQPFGFVAVAGDCNDNLYYVNPGATELCGNNQDDDCDGTINEGCPIGGPSNDEFILASAVAAPSFPFCANRTVNLTNATPSPQASTTAPVGAGQDVWYAFVAQTNGARITSTSVACDVVIELQDATNAVIGVENETTTGAEILVANNLTPGDTYYVLVRNFNASSVGTVSTCIQNLTYSAPDNGTTFNNLCSFIKCDWNGAQQYSVTLTAEDGFTTYTASSNTTQIPFASFGALEYGATYYAVFTSTFIQNDAAGNPTTVVVTSPTWAITIEDHLPVALRSTDRCPTTRSIGAFIGTDRVICGAIGYEWEFTLSDEFGNAISLDPVVVQVNANSRYIRTTSIGGVQPGDYYLVRVRPLFSYGAGVYGDAYMLCIAGSAGISTEGGNATPSLTSVNAERSVKLYPNPNNGEMINIQLTGITSETVQVNVIDALGRVITSNQYSVNNTFNGTILFDTKLSSGMYNVQIIDGEAVMVERVIIR